MVKNESYRIYKDVQYLEDFGCGEDSGRGQSGQAAC